MYAASPSVYVACKWLSDLGHGPNKPTATIIGEYRYSASYHHDALIFSLVRVRISESDKNLAPDFRQHIIDHNH